MRVWSKRFFITKFSFQTLKAHRLKDSSSVFKKRTKLKLIVLLKNLQQKKMTDQVILHSYISWNIPVSGPTILVCPGHSNEHRMCTGQERKRIDALSFWAMEPLSAYLLFWGRLRISPYLEPKQSNLTVQVQTGIHRRKKKTTGTLTKKKRERLFLNSTSLTIKIWSTEW